MLAMLKNPAEAYARVGVETGVVAADPHRLVLMLFDGALVAIGQARAALAAGDVARKGGAISRAIQIIEEGLRASLDHEDGGEIAAQLEQLYDYVSRRLLTANLRGDPAALEEVGRIVSELRDAWAAMPRDAARREGETAR